MKSYKGTIIDLPENGIFVFGSNTQGRHGKGAALVAMQKFGAIYGQSKGLQGKSYAVITKDLTKKIHPSISPEDIISQIRELYNFARQNLELDFYIIYSGNGINLNNYSNEEMASFFASGYITNNIIFEEEFSKLVFNTHRKL